MQHRYGAKLRDDGQICLTASVGGPKVVLLSLGFIETSITWGLGPLAPDSVFCQCSKNLQRFGCPPDFVEILDIIAARMRMSIGIALDLRGGSACVHATCSILSRRKKHIEVQ